MEEEETKIKSPEFPAPVLRAALLEDLLAVDPAHLGGPRPLRRQRPALHERPSVRPSLVTLVRVVVIVLKISG